jgi:hypothetical protein
MTLRKGYQPRTNTVKGDLVTDSRSILARRMNHLSQLLNVHGVNDDRQTEIQTAQPLIPKDNAVEFEMATKHTHTHTHTNTHKPSNINQNQAELINHEAGNNIGDPYTC